MISFFLVIFQGSDGTWTDLGGGNYNSMRGARQGVAKVWRWYRSRDLVAMCRILRVTLNPDGGETRSEVIDEINRSQ